MGDIRTYLADCGGDSFAQRALHDTDLLVFAPLG